MPIMSVKPGSAKLHASLRFFGAYHQIPQQAQGPVWDCVTRLIQNPAHPSLNYEVIKTAADPRLRFVRVNDHYRMMIAHPSGRRMNRSTRTNCAASMACWSRCRCAPLSEIGR